MAKYRVTFNGQNASGYTSCYGAKFPCGKTITVELDGHAFQKLDNHPEFDVVELKGKAAETAVEPAHN